MTFKKRKSSTSLGTIEIDQVRLNTIKSDTQDLNDTDLSVAVSELDSTSQENNTGKAQMQP